MSIRNPEDHAEIDTAEKIEQNSEQEGLGEKEREDLHNDMLSDVNDKDFETDELNENKENDKSEEKESQIDSREKSIEQTGEKTEEPISHEQMLQDVNDGDSSELTAQNQLEVENIQNDESRNAEKSGYNINDVSEAVDAKEGYEAEIRNMSPEEYQEQKELDQRVKENDSQPDMTETTVPNNDIQNVEENKTESPEKKKSAESRDTETSPENESEEDKSKDMDEKIDNSKITNEIDDSSRRGE